MKRFILTAAALTYTAIFTLGNAQGSPVTIPAGTAVRVRTIEAIGVKSAALGTRYHGSLADPLVSHSGAILIPRGAPVTLSVVSVKKAGILSGRDRIGLKLDSITFNGKTYHLVTTVAESKGKGKGKRTLTGTGIGAGAGGLIGGLAGGGTGFAVGALVGGGGGTAVAAATGDKHLIIPPESVLTFQLHSPLSL
jgi:hypothetical protein